MRALRLVVAAALTLVVAAADADGRQLRPHRSLQKPDPVLSALARTATDGTISQPQAAAYRRTYIAASAEIRRLHGQRAKELGSTVAIARGIAAHGALSPSRMGSVFLTLERNLQWWSSHGPPPAGSGVEPAAQGRHCKPLAAQDGHTASPAGSDAVAGSDTLTAPSATPDDFENRADPDAAASNGAAEPEAHAANFSFADSGIVYEYYPGMGLQLQVNATFGSVNALLTEDTLASFAKAQQTLDEMLPLASDRHGLLTWEYEFPFEGGLPPWTSGLAQATAIESLTRAAAMLRQPDYLTIALRLARLFATPPPTGVGLRTSGGGEWFLLYSFAPGQLVLNADLDALIALHDLAAATRDPFVTALDANGVQTLTRTIARFDAGNWSLYAQGGPLASLNYQALNYELARKLCLRTGIAAVCGAAGSFDRELNTRCPLIEHGIAAPVATRASRRRRELERATLGA